MATVQELLTIELASRNPVAYRAHFERLESTEQRTYLSTLTTDGLRVHVRTLGEKAVVGLSLQVRPDGSPRLEATVAGQLMPAVTGWVEVGALLSTTRGLAESIGDPVVTCLVSLSPAQLGSYAGELRGLGLQVTEVEFVEDAGCEGFRPQCEWSLRGQLGSGGEAWSARQLVPWAKRDQVRVALERSAPLHGARFTLRRS